MTRVQLKREYMEQNKRYKILKICQISPQISTDKEKKTYRRNIRNIPPDILEYSGRDLLRNCYFLPRYHSFAGYYI